MSIFDEPLEPYYERTKKKVHHNQHYNEHIRKGIILFSKMLADELGYFVRYTDHDIRKRQLNLNLKGD